MHALPLRAKQTKLLHPRYEHAIRWCVCVLPVIEYYVLRHLLANLLHLNLILIVLRVSWKREVF